MRSRLLALCLLAAAGCGPSVPDRAPTIVGPITNRGGITAVSGGRQTILVRPAGDACGIVFGIDRDDTQILRSRAGGELEEIGASELQIGMTVRVWSEYVLTSCPGQANADVIEVID